MFVQDLLCDNLQSLICSCASLETPSCRIADGPVNGLYERQQYVKALAMDIDARWNEIYGLLELDDLAADSLNFYSDDRHAHGPQSGDHAAQKKSWKLETLITQILPQTAFLFDLSKWSS